jgi:hypothetical protein
MAHITGIETGHQRTITMRRYNVMTGMNYAERQAYRESRKAQIAEEKARKQASAMTCQCCGRQIFAQRGKIAHHGYERPGYGWQTASCMGALYAPFEVFRDRLADLIVSLNHALDDAKGTLRAIKAEKVKLAFSVDTECEPYFDGTYGRRQKFSKPVTEFFSRSEFEALAAEGDRESPVYQAHQRACGDARSAGTRQPVEPKAVQVYRASLYRSYDDMKDAAIRETEGRIKALEGDIELSETRYAGWQQTHTHFDKATKEWQVKG